MNLRAEIHILSYIDSLPCVKDTIITYNASLANVKIYSTTYLATKIYNACLVLVYKVYVSINPISHNMRRKQLYAMDEVTLVTYEEDKDLIFNLLAKGNIGRYMILLIYPPPMILFEYSLFLEFSFEN